MTEQQPQENFSGQPVQNNAPVQPQQSAPQVPVSQQAVASASYTAAPAPNGGTQQVYGAAPAQYPQQVVAPKKSHVGLIIGLVVAALLLLGFVGTIASCSSALGSLASVSDMGVITTGDTVAVINMDGTIQYDGTNNSPEGLRDVLMQAENDDNIKAIVLRVDSGGGLSAAGEEMSQLVAECKKPIVVSSASMNASAAYEISSQAEYIYTDLATAIGSIGTIMSVADLSELYEKIGIKYTDIASADSKNSSYGHRPLTEDEIAHEQAMVDEINEAFIENVAKGRGMDVEDVRKVATGEVFTGRMAVEYGLADASGTYDDALEKAKELGGIQGDYDVVTLESSYFTWSSLLGLSSSSKIDVDSLAKMVEALEESSNNIAY